MHVSEFLLSILHNLESPGKREPKLKDVWKILNELPYFEYLHINEYFYKYSLNEAMPLWLTMFPTRAMD